MVTESMLTTEYIIHGPTDLTIAIVADLHEHDPAAVLSILKEVSPDVIAVPGDLFENHEFGENLDKEDESLISRLCPLAARIQHRFLDGEIHVRLLWWGWRTRHSSYGSNISVEVV